MTGKVPAYEMDRKSTVRYFLAKPEKEKVGLDFP